jgi:hypothetical protein
VGGEVGGLGGEDLGGLGRGDGSVGVGDELGAGGSDAGEENLENYGGKEARLDYNRKTWSECFKISRCKHVV